MGEKITFSGKGYDEISSPLDERIMFNAVRFFKAAASGDMNTIKNMADENLYKEVENELVGQKDTSFVLGGDFVVRLKELSKYEKPVSISAPIKIYSPPTTTLKPCPSIYFLISSTSSSLSCFTSLSAYSFFKNSYFPLPY